jgi:hypothetical protein
VTTEILDELGDEKSSVVRFNFRATSRAGNPYDVEYVLFAKARNGLVYEVVEMMDSMASSEQVAARRLRPKGNLYRVGPNGETWSNTLTENPY